MARAGRKRKQGEREPNGQLRRRPTTVAQIEAAQRAQEEAEMAVVLAQPHRRGSRSQNRATALGRFVEDNGLRPEFIQAGEHYGSLRRKWAAAKGAPMPDRLGGSGRDIPAEVVKRWGDQVFELEAAMLRAGVAALGAVERLAYQGFDLPPNTPKQDAIDGFMALAVELGLVEPRRC
jgi:hypothetical protein